MKILGIDFGTKRIGISVSDPYENMAFPLTVIHNRGITQNLLQLEDIIAQYGAEKIVIGYPLNMDGSEGFKAREVKAFGAQVEQKFNIPVIYWDERLTTNEALEILANEKVAVKKRQKLVDKLAAQIILKSYLDSKENK